MNMLGLLGPKYPSPTAGKSLPICGFWVPATTIYLGIEVESA